MKNSVYKIVSNKNKSSKAKIYILLALVGFSVLFGLIFWGNNFKIFGLNTKSLNCSRTTPYENNPEFGRALSLYKQRIEKIDPELGKIVNCVQIKSDDLRGKSDAEGLFLFDKENADGNNLPIYVDNSYTNTDDLSTALLMSHEITHARQFIKSLNGEDKSTCIEKEAEAFSAQLSFFLSLNQDELKSILSRVQNDDTNPQTRQVSDLLNYTYYPAIDYCPKNDSECIAQQSRYYVYNYVQASPAYQKQCNIAVPADIDLPTPKPQRVLVQLATGYNYYCDEDKAVSIYNLSVTLEKLDLNRKDTLEKFRVAESSCYDRCIVNNFPGCTYACTSQFNEAANKWNFKESNDIAQRTDDFNSILLKYCSQ